ncbi:MAG: cupin domain-containing protein [Planctomycetota bacterium]
MSTETGTDTVYAPDMAWEPALDFPGTAETKILRDDGPGQARTAFIRLHAGGHVTPHAHLGTVQHYVVEGEYESEGTIYAAGTYRRLPPHANVPEMTTQNGVTVLMIYDPVC